MRDLLSIGTSRGHSMIGTGIGLGLSGFRMPNSLFAPSQLQGLTLWLDASDSSTVYQSSGGSTASANGDPVGYWIDKSGNNKHASQTDGLLKPVLETNSRSSKNGIKFPDGTDYFDLASSISGIKHVFFVAKRNRTLGGTYATLFRDSSGNDRDGFFVGDVVSGTGRYYLQAGASGGSIVGYSNWTNVPNDTTWFFEAWSDGVNRNLRVNASTSVSSANAFDITTSQIGRYHVGGYSFAGVLYEACMFTTQLSAANVASMQTYLRGKWGTP